MPPAFVTLLRTLSRAEVGDLNGRSARVCQPELDVAGCCQKQLALAANAAVHCFRASRCASRRARARRALGALLDALMAGCHAPRRTRADNADRLSLLPPPPPSLLLRQRSAQWPAASLLGVLVLITPPCDADASHSFRHLRPRRCCRSTLLGGWLPLSSGCSC